MARALTIGPRKLAVIALLGLWIAVNTIGGSRFGSAIGWAGIVAIVTSAVLGFAVRERQRASRPAHPRRTHRTTGPTRTWHPGSGTSQAGEHCSCGVDSTDLQAAKREVARTRRRAAQNRERYEHLLDTSDPVRTWRRIIHRAREHGSPCDPMPVWVFPRLDLNSYQDLIYQEFPRHGLDVRPVRHFRELDDVPDRGIVHYHWTRHIQHGARNRADAERRMADAIGRFRALKERGVQLVWSIHEALPHECPFPDVEIQYRKWLAANADALHVLHDSTFDEVSSLFNLPRDKSFVVEHPLYSGYQPDHVTRTACRAELGLADDDLLILCFGAIRPYKAYERVIDSLPLVRSRFDDRTVRLLIAGPVLDGVAIKRYVSDLERRAAADPGTVVAPWPVPDAYVHRLFRAADLAVYPYRQGLNSGALFMSLSFATPTLIARNGVTQDYESHGPITTFEEDEDLAELIVRCLSEPHPRPVDPSLKQSHRPERVSSRLAEHFVERLAQPNQRGGRITGEARLVETSLGPRFNSHPSDRAAG